MERPRVSRQVPMYERGCTPPPKHPSDRIISKAIKTQIMSGARTRIVVDATFQSNDGRKYVTSKVTDLDSKSNGRQSDSLNHSLREEPRVTTVTRKHRIYGWDSVGSLTDDELDDFREEMLRLHNSIRADHAAEPLSRSDSLTDLAQNWADLLATQKTLKHQTDHLYKDSQVGQNIACKNLSEPPLPSVPDDLSPAAELMYQWYLQSDDFFESNTDLSAKELHLAGGNFTQVVWKSSKELGVGLSRNSSKGETYVVCFYYPSGNIADQFISNISSVKFPLV